MSDEAVESVSEESEQPSALAFDVGSLPSELAGEPCLKNFDTVDKLANSYVHAVRKMGAPPENFLKVPTKEGESWDDVYRAIGRPDTAEGYSFEDYESDDDGHLDEFKQWAHGENFTNDQAHVILDELNTMIARGKEQTQDDNNRAMMDAESALMKEWPGHRFEEEMDYAQRSFRQFADKEVQELVDNSGIGNQPAFVKFFAKIGRAMGEANMVLGKPNQIGDLTPQSALDKIQDLYSDPEFVKAYSATEHPGYKDASKRMDRLFKIAYANN